MATAVTSSGNTHHIVAGARISTTTAAGVKYVIICDTTANQLRMMKLVSGTWTEVDVLQGISPGGDSLRAPSLCIDGSGVIRMVFWNNYSAAIEAAYPSGLCYVAFSPSTDTFDTVYQMQAPAVALALPTNYGTACAISRGGANDRVQVAYCDISTTRAGNSDAIYYCNIDVSGLAPVASTKILIGSTRRFPDILITRRDTNKLPLITDIAEAGRVEVFYGNQANATSFTAVSLTSSALTTNGTYNIPQIVEDHAGNHYLFSATSAGIIARSKHTHGVSYGTWASANITNGLDYLYSRVAAASRGYATGIRDKYLIGQGVPGFGISDWLAHSDDFNKFATDTWRLEHTAIQDSAQVKMTWANYSNHFGTSRIDYFYVVSGEVYHDFIQMNQVR